MSGFVGNRLWSQIWATAQQSGSATARSPAAAASFAAPLRRWATPFSRFSTAAFRLPPKSARYTTTRSFASGFFLYGMSPGSPTTNLSTCTTALEKTICVPSPIDRPKLSRFTTWNWCRPLHTSKRRNRIVSRRNKSSTTKGDRGKTPEAKQPAEPNGSSNYLQLPKNLQNLQPPTKEELLAAANGFWSRLKVRFKWFSIRSVRPWNIDDWSAFASWLLVGHLVWIFVGTTTFFSLVILAINTVAAQETLARWVGDYLTQSAGVKVVFESAIVPNWRDGVISFRNVFVSRRPGQGKTKVSKGSSSSAAAAAAAERAAEHIEPRDAEQDDGNYTQFDVTIDTVNVTLSLVKWWSGKGLLRDVEVKGVRGVVDRTHVRWDGPRVDPKSYRLKHNPGDFEIDQFKLEDLLISIHQPNDFRPFSVSIFTCELSQLRKQWLFYDVMSANNMSGSFDGSLFTIHQRQLHKYSGMKESDSAEEHAWKKQNRLRIDGLNVDHLNRGVEGPFSWIYEANVDIVADVMIPAEPDASLTRVMSDFYDRMEAAVTSKRYMGILESHPSTTDLNTPEFRASVLEKQQQRDDDRRYLVMDLRVNLNDARAAVPIFSPDLSYINSALIRPIVAYINSRRTSIPIKCRIVKRASEFDGSWTIFDSGLMDELSAETYDAISKDVVDNQARMRRLKKVGLWTLSMAVQALFMGMAGSVV